MSGGLMEFLLARIAEDEERARRTVLVSETGPGKSHVGDAFRLAECEAKRRIVEEHGANRYRVDPCDAHDLSGRTIPCYTLCALAEPYADHPDFRQEWKP